MNLLPFVIFGAGGHGKVVLDASKAAGLSIDLIIDDSPKSPELFGIPIISSSDPKWLALQDFRFVVGIGNNLIPKEYFEGLVKKNGAPRIVIHPFSYVSKEARIGYGTVVFAGSVINPGASLGANCIVNTSASVDHDCVIGSHTHLCPGVRLAGGVSIGSLTMIGTGASVLPGIAIGSHCVIGAGSVVTKNVPDCSIVCGVPARPVKT